MNFVLYICVCKKEKKGRKVGITKIIRLYSSKDVLIYIYRIEKKNYIFMNFIIYIYIYKKRKLLD